MVSLFEELGPSGLGEADSQQVTIQPGKFSALVYDVEVQHCIPDRSGIKTPGLKYCDGWGDHKGMGISVIGVYDYLTDTCQVFMRDNFHHFQNLVDAREHIIGFGSYNFDDKLCAAHDIEVRTTYDLLQKVRSAVSKLPKAQGAPRPSYNLAALAQTNLGRGKTGSGADAPLLWQRGRVGELISYCLHDVQVTKALFDRREQLKDPNSERLLYLEPLGEGMPAQSQRSPNLQSGIQEVVS